MFCRAYLCRKMLSGRREITTLIGVERAVVHMAVVVVIVIPQPVVIGRFGVGYFTLYLHPSVGEWYVLEIDETSPALKHWTGVATFNKVTAGQWGVEHGG